MLGYDVERGVFVRNTLDDGEEGCEVVNVHSVGMYRFGEHTSLLAELS